MARTVRPLSSYPPEFFLAWEEAKKGTLYLTFDSSGVATNFKMRLYQFRKRMLEENPEEGQKLYGIDLKVEGETLISYVPEWKKQLLSSVPRPPTEPPPPFEPPTEEPAGENLDATLNKLGFGTEGK